MSSFIHNWIHEESLDQDIEFIVKCYKVIALFIEDVDNIDILKFETGCIDIFGQLLNSNDTAIYIRFFINVIEDLKSCKKTKNEDFPKHYDFLPCTLLLTINQKNHNNSLLWHDNEIELMNDMASHHNDTNHDTYNSEELRTLLRILKAGLARTNSIQATKPPTPVPEVRITVTTP